MNETGISPQNSLNTRSREKFGEKTPFHSLRSLRQRNGDTLERARAYVDKLPCAVSGQRGHDALFRVACVLAHGFSLADADAGPILAEYNARCLPPWNDRELRHKLAEARKATHREPLGHLLASATATRRHEPPQPPRVLGRITLPDEPGRTFTATATPSRASRESLDEPDEAEARRIAGELLRAHRDGALAGPDDPAAAPFARAIHIFGGNYLPGNPIPGTGSSTP